MVLLRNNQSGSFLAPITTPVQGAFVAAADWDGDGLVDVVGTNGNANVALVGWNRGGGTFEQIGVVQSGYETHRAGAADLNGDGRPEIVVCNLRARSLSVFANTSARPLEVTRTVSRKTHGNAGTFDIDLPLTGTPGIESRGSGDANSHQLIVSFPSPVTFSSATVQSGSATVESAAATGSQVTVNLANVANAQRLTIALSGVSDGSSTTEIIVPMSVLLGDVNGSAVVTASDIGQAKAQSGEPVSQANFRSDVNANGAITASDVGLVKSRSGNSLP